MDATPTPPRLRQRRQQGVTLLVVMVMLVVIGLVSASALRRAANADLLANNSRLEQLAKQAAEAGLRFCEAQIISPKPAVTIAAANAVAPAWNTFSNWQSKGTATTVPEAFLKSTVADSSMPLPRQMPQCMAEFSPLGTNVVIITARGFSPDYKALANGETQNGSVIWLQSIVSLQS